MDNNLLTQGYLRYTGRKKVILLLLTAGIVFLSLVAVNAGAIDFKPWQVLQAVLGQGSGVSEVVIWNIRLPRVLAGIIAGAGLAVAGCVMQNNLKNPLASPSTLGIASAAAFGANIAIIVLGAGSFQSTSTDAVIINNPYLVTVFAFLSAMAAALAILALAGLRSFSPEAMVLAGVAISSLFSAGTIFIQYFAQDVKIAAVVFWTFGDLGRASWREVGLMTLIVTVSLLYYMMRAWDYNALNSGEEGAVGLGVRVEKVRREGMFVSSLVTAVVVSFLGVIGFIGLVGPQMARRIIGSDYRYLLPASALLGSFLLLASDTVARTIISPAVLPVGAVTSFLGAPLFLYLLVRGQRR